MRLLYIAPSSIVPPVSGNRQMLLGFLRWISTKATCDVALVYDQPAELTALESTLRGEIPNLHRIRAFPKPAGMARAAARITAAGCGLHPAMGNYDSAGLKRWLKTEAIAADYDLVHFDMFHMAPYRKYVGTLPTFLCASDAYSMAAASARETAPNFGGAVQASVGAWAMRAIERKYYKTFTAVGTVARRDATLLSQAHPEINAVVIRLPLPDEIERDTPRAFAPANQCAGILCAVNVAHPSIANEVTRFLDRYLPTIRHQVPGTQMTILGRAPSEKNKQRWQRAGVTCLDYVPSYVSLLKADWVFVFPSMCGSGLQTRVQQAMAMGLPVVSSPEGMSGLEATHNLHGFSCTVADEWIGTVRALLLSSDLRVTIGMAAAAHIRQHFSEAKAGAHLLNIYQGLIGYETPRTVRKEV